MDCAKRRCFLEVYTSGCEEPRLLQLEPHVAFQNVLQRFEGEGILYWGTHQILPEETPASLRMLSGIANAQVLSFVPYPQIPPPHPGAAHVPPFANPSASSDNAREGLSLMAGDAACPTPTNLDEHGSDPSTSPLSDHVAQSNRQGPRAAALRDPPQMTSRAWRTRPGLLSPDLHMVMPTASPADQKRTAVAPKGIDRSAQSQSGRAHESDKAGRVELSSPRSSLRHQSSTSPGPPPAPGRPPMRRNMPIVMEPCLLVDLEGGPAKFARAKPPPQSGLARRAGSRGVSPGGMRHAGGQLVEVGGAPLLPGHPFSAEPSVEELAASLHERLLRRLYVQRRLYLVREPPA